MFVNCVMGLFGSKDHRSADQINQDIEAQLKTDALKSKREIKFLLLGAGESGKSTVLKQMRIIHQNGFDDDEVMQQRYAIHSNIIQSMATIIRAMRQFRLEFDDPYSEVLMKKTELILDAANRSNIDGEAFTSKLVEAIRILWSQKAVKVCYERRSEYQLIDSAEYFFDNVLRIGETEYKPTEQDILRARVKTNGVVEVNFNLKGRIFRVFDAGGQRSERKKWIHLFADVDAVIFVVALSEYDQMLLEDDSTNRMADSLRLFESICNLHWFTRTAIILFLNKKDLFKEKIKRVNITNVFPLYPGEQNYEEASLYIEEQYKSVSRDPKKKIYTHQTCATDTSQLLFVLNSTTDLIIQKNMTAIGFAI